jgi:hypothetical protein
MRRQPTPTDVRYSPFTEGISLTSSLVPLPGRVIPHQLGYNFKPRASGPEGRLCSAPFFRRSVGTRTVFPRTPLRRWVANGQLFVRSHRTGHPDETGRSCLWDSNVTFRAPLDLEESRD